MHKLSSFFLSALLALAGWISLPGSGICDDVGYYAPSVPLSSLYVIDARIDMVKGFLEGRETVSFKNSTRRRIEVVAFNWSVNQWMTIEVYLKGQKLYPPPDSPGVPQNQQLYVRLPRPLEPSERIELNATFRLSNPKPINDSTAMSIINWYPRLWWEGLAQHNAYSVKLDITPGWALAASGRLDPKTGRYEAASAASFGLYIAKGMKTATQEVDGVLITSVFAEKGAKAAGVCMETAAKAVHFYHKWLGFYPFPFLTIIPGQAARMGGYPVATGIVAIHGLETYMDGEPPLHWQYITSHEIGHQYWGEWVLDADNPAWLWIAMGIFADTEFMTTSGFDPNRRAAWMENYVNSILMHYDTTLDISPSQAEMIRFDRNNTVIHSKGPVAIFALDSILGRDLFLRIYKKCLRDYGGKRLGWRQFQMVCEEESGRNLQWFFDAWIRSNKYLSYAVDSLECKPEPTGGHSCEVRVRQLGTMAMPVPVKVMFEDGTEQRAWIDRNQAVTSLSFHSSAKLSDVILDPDGRFAMTKHPVAKISTAAATRLSYGWEPGSAPEVYSAVKDEPITYSGFWYKLGSDLYRSNHLDEALGCFRKMNGPESDRMTRLTARSWLGVLEDLRENRPVALAHYKEALAMDPGEGVDDRTLQLRIDRVWLEARLKSPFTRFSLSTQPTVEELVNAVNRLNYTDEGKNPLLIFEETPGLEIRNTGFWFKLGLLLFDSGYYSESLSAFKKIESLEQSGVIAFAAMVWQGHLNDLLGNRDRAVACYRNALKLDTGDGMQHDQYRMVIDHHWIELRLKTPFTRQKP